VLALPQHEMTGPHMEPHDRVGGIGCCD
jgi:hypothetical protein